MATRKSASPKGRSATKSKAPATETVAVAATSSTKRHFAPKVARFIDEYMVDLCGSAAYRRAGYRATGRSAEVSAHRLLRKPEVAAEIAERKQKTAEKLQISREDALAHAWNVVLADARELIEFVVGCCRHCHGTDFGFQWRDREEFELAVETATREHDKQVKAANAKPGTIAPVLRLPNDRGGYGFDPRLGAHSNCPRCLGAGEGRAVVKDTRTLSPTAAALYAGVKQTKEGLEVKMHSKLDALEKIFRHLGLYERDNDQKKPIGLSAELAAFAAALHSNNAGRLPFAPARKA